MSADEVIARLGLAAHPEGGWYRETWRAGAALGERESGTAIYYLLEKDQRSHWHRVDATEIWHFYAGAPLELRSSADGKKVKTAILGPDLSAHQLPQITISPSVWQSAKSTGDWTLVGCTVSPGFRFDCFEIAPPNWEPAQSEA